MNTTPQGSLFELVVTTVLTWIFLTAMVGGAIVLLVMTIRA